MMRGRTRRCQARGSPPPMGVAVGVQVSKEGHDLKAGFGVRLPVGSSDRIMEAWLTSARATARAALTAGELVWFVYCAILAEHR